LKLSANNWKRAISFYRKLRCSSFNYEKICESVGIEWKINGITANSI
jgi:hypothetical protein